MQFKQVIVILANFIMPPTALLGVATLMLRVCSPCATHKGTEMNKHIRVLSMANVNLQRKQTKNKSFVNDVIKEGTLKIVMMYKT